VRLSRLAINPPEKGVFLSGVQTTTLPTPKLALAPDGHAIVFDVATADGREMLWIRSLDDPVARPLPGTEDVLDVCWSPDSQWLAFDSEGKIKKIPVGGGPVQVVAPTKATRGMSWSGDGTILFAMGNEGIFRVSASGGPVEPVTKFDSSRREGSHRWPRFLPDGRHFLYTIRSATPEWRGIYVGSLDGKVKKLLAPPDSE